MMKIYRSDFGDWLRILDNLKRTFQVRDAIKYLTICPIVIICRYLSRSYIVGRKKNSECYVELMSRTESMYLRYESASHGLCSASLICGIQGVAGPFYIVVISIEPTIVLFSSQYGCRSPDH